MSESKEPFRDKVKEIVISVGLTAVLQGILVSLILGFLFNKKLETYKNELANTTERLKVLLQLNEPFTKQRISAYLDIEQGARRVYRELIVYYAGVPEEEIWSGRFDALENDIGTGSGSAGGSFVTNQDVIKALRDFNSIREKNADVISDSINAAVDSFLETITEDLRKAHLKENRAESFDAAARERLKAALNRLDSTINQALRISELPVK
jgi:hypothetical protein